MYKKCTANSSIKKMDINTKKMKKAKIMPTVHTGTCAHTCTSSTYTVHDIYVRCSVRTSAQPFHIFNAITFFERFECSDWIWNTNCKEGSLLARNFRLAKIWIFNSPLMFTHSLTHSLTHLSFKVQRRVVYLSLFAPFCVWVVVVFLQSSLSQSVTQSHSHSVRWRNGRGTGLVVAVHRWGRTVFNRRVQGAQYCYWRVE